MHKCRAARRWLPKKSRLPPFVFALLLVSSFFGSQRAGQSRARCRLRRMNGGPTCERESGRRAPPPAAGRPPPPPPRACRARSPWYSTLTDSHGHFQFPRLHIAHLCCHIRWCRWLAGVVVAARILLHNSNPLRRDWGRVGRFTAGQKASTATPACTAVPAGSGTALASPNGAHTMMRARHAVLYPQRLNHISNERLNRNTITR